LESTLQQDGYYDLEQIAFPSVPQFNARTSSATFLETKYLIRLDIFIYRENNNPATAISENDARDYVCEANQLFREADTGIQFYVNTVSIDGNSTHNNQLSSQFDAYLMFVQKRIFLPHKGINVHFVRYTQSGLASKTGLSSIPRYNIPLEEYSLLVRTHRNPIGVPREPENIISTFAHELGHNIGLLHTHHPGRIPSLIFNQENATIVNGCYQEAVWRGRENRWYDGCFFTHNKLKARINGDFLEDTQADPNMSGLIDSNCGFNPPPSGDFRYDNWGDAWTPNTNNIMAYTQPTCRNFFTHQQTGVMWYETSRLRYFYLNDQVPKVSMADFVCTSSTIATLANAPSHANITWQVEPANLVATASGIGSTANLGAATNRSKGSATITYTIVGNGDCYMARIKKTFWVGKSGNVSSLLVLSPNWNSQGETCPNQSLELYADDNNNPATTSYNWNIQGATITNALGPTAIVKTWNNIGVPLYFAANAYNNCGASNTVSVSGVTINCNGGGGQQLAVLSPNPADKEATVSLTNVFAHKDVTEAEVYLYNNLNEVVFDKRVKEEILIIPVGNIADGLYHLKVLYLDKSFQRHLRIKH
jgi:hypothetical protein